MIRSNEFDHRFAKEIMAEPGGENLLTCWSCGTCAATCIVRRYEPEFNPRLILHKAGLGLREEVLSSAEIWQCSACDACYPRCPKGIHISDVMKAIRNIAIREGYERPGETASVNVGSCVACGMCVAACPYEAINLETVKWNRRTKVAAQVNPNLCMGCGICNSVCPSSSISVEGISDLQVYKSLFAKLHALESQASQNQHGKVLAIVCNYCLHSTADADNAMNPPEGVEVVRVPCAGRVSPLLVTTALQGGADAVLIIGCKEGECHYKKGNELQGGRSAMLGELLGMMGFEQGRVLFARLGSLDRGKFAELVDQVVKDAQALGPLAWGN